MTWDSSFPYFGIIAMWAFKSLGIGLWCIFKGEKGRQKMWFKGLAESFIVLKRQTIRAGRLTKLHVFKGFVKLCPSTGGFKFAYCIPFERERTIFP